MKMPCASNNVGFLPTESLNFPQNGITAALPIMCVAPVQAKPESEISRATDMVGKAVVRTTVSIETRKTEMQMAKIITDACI